MGKKGKVTLYMDLEVVREAKEIGLNISKVAENALKEAIKRLKGEDCKNNHSLSSNRMAKHTYKAGPAGLEPATPGSGGRCSNPPELRAQK